MKSWTLIDVSKGTHFSMFVPPPEEQPNGCHFGLETLGDGMREGVRLLSIKAGDFTIEILPTRGMGIWKGAYKDVPIGWQAPVNGPVHPQFVPVAQPDGLGWLWGFDEMLARCGLEFSGTPDFDEKNRLKYSLHGLVSNIPAHKLVVNFDEAKGELSVAGEVDEKRLHFSKLRLKTTYRIKVGSPRLEIEDEIVNISGAPGECQMLYHVNFGAPLCAPGSKLFAPVETIVPRTKHAADHIGHWQDFGPAQPGFEEQVYFYRLHADEIENTMALLRDPEKKAGVSLHWSRKQLPFFTLWKNQVAFEDGYVVGIEPGTNFPNPRSYESKEGRTVKLPPGGSHKMSWAIEVHPDAASVAAAEKRIEDIAKNRPPQILETKASWIMPSKAE